MQPINKPAKPINALTKISTTFILPPAAPEPGVALPAESHRPKTDGGCRLPPDIRQAVDPVPPPRSPGPRIAHLLSRTSHRPSRVAARGRTAVQNSRSGFTAQVPISPLAGPRPARPPRQRAALAGGPHCETWCAVEDSNLRPLPCQGSALPLSQQRGTWSGRRDSNPCFRLGRTAHWPLCYARETLRRIVSRVLSRTIIHLGQPLPDGSSTQPVA